MIITPVEHEPSRFWVESTSTPGVTHMVDLDDNGAERDTTGFASEQLNTLLGCRADKWTILTSNLSLSQLGDIDPRIADRMIRSPNIIVQLSTISHSLR